MNMEMMYTLLTDLVDKTKHIDPDCLQAVLCMVLEENCKAHGVKMLDAVQKMLDAAIYVNETCGEY